MFAIRYKLIIIILPLVLIVALFLNRNVFALDLPDWNAVKIDIDIPDVSVPTIPPVPTTPPVPTLPIDFGCPTCETPTPPQDPSPTPTSPPGGGGGGGGGGAGGGGGGAGGGEVLGATTYAPTGVFEEGLMYLSFILGLVFLSKSISTRYGKKYQSAR